MATPQRQAAAAVGHGAAAGCGAAAGDDMDGLVGMVLGGCIKEELGGYDLQSQTRPLEESRRMSIFLLTKGVQCSDIWLGLSFLLFCISYPARSGAPATRSWIFLAMHGSEVNSVGWECVSYVFLESHYQVDASKELPPWFLERQNITRRHPGQGGQGWPGFFPVGISNHAENAAMAISKCQP